MEEERRAAPDSSAKRRRPSSPSSPSPSRSLRRPRRFDRLELWRAGKDEWLEHVESSERFHEHLREHAVPLDRRALLTSPAAASDSTYTRCWHIACRAWIVICISAGVHYRNSSVQQRGRQTLSQRACVKSCLMCWPPGSLSSPTTPMRTAARSSIYLIF
jgi:hypothetical protein